MKEYKTINQNKVDIEIGYKKQALIDMMKSDEELGLYDDIKINRIELVCKDCSDPLEDCTCIKSTVDFPKQKTLEEAAYRLSIEKFEPKHTTFMLGVIEGAKWQQDKMLKFILDEDNHTEGELGNSCIDVQTLVHFIEQFKKK